MKQYNLRIQYDQDAESPREDRDNLGFFLTNQGRYISPDQNEDLKSIISQAYNESPKNVDDHIKKIKRLYRKQFGENLVLIETVSKYEHGNIKYYLGGHEVCRWDSGLVGFYIVTKDSLKTLHGSKRPRNKTLLKYIKAEIETYNKWASGEVFGFQLEEVDTREIDGKEFINKEFVDSCWGFYDIEHIRECLPDSFKNEDLNNYLI